MEMRGALPDLNRETNMFFGFLALPRVCKQDRIGGVKIIVGSINCRATSNEPTS